jgi:hypothetical protein
MVVFIRTLFIGLYILLLLVHPSQNIVTKSNNNLRRNGNATLLQRNHGNLFQFHSNGSSSSSSSSDFIRTTSHKQTQSFPAHHSISLESISPTLRMQLIAGTSSSGFSGDGNPATSAQINAGYPWVDSLGNIYLPSASHQLIRKVSFSGIISTFGGIPGSSSVAGTSGPINSVNFFNCISVMGDTAGTALYISDQRYVWKYLFSNNIVSVFAHTIGSAVGFSGDGNAATTALLNNPMGLWLTTSGVLYIADDGNHRIRKVNSNNIISTVAGSGATGGPGTFSGDAGPALAATLYNPQSIYMDTLGKLFIADTTNCRIRVVDTNNIITTFAGYGTTTLSYNGDDLPVSAANIVYPQDVKGDSLGNIYVADWGIFIIRMIKNGIISTLFGNPTVSGFSSGLSPPNGAINSPAGMWIDSLGVGYFSDTNSIHKSVELLPTSQPSGQPTGQPSRRPSTQPTGQPSSHPSKYSLRNQFMELVAGSAAAGFSGDNGPATSALMVTIQPWVDSSGNLYIADSSSYRIRKINQINGIITTFGGNGTRSITGIGGPITSTDFSYCFAITGDAARTALYFSDLQYVWKYLFANNIVSVLAHAIGAVAGFSGDGNPATSAQLNCVVRVVDTHGIISTFTGIPGSCAYTTGTGSLASSIHTVEGLWVDSRGVVYVSDYNSIHRSVDLSPTSQPSGQPSGQPSRRPSTQPSSSPSHQQSMIPANVFMQLVAGTDIPGSSGDNGRATSAQMNEVRFPWVDSSGNVFIPDRINAKIRKVSASTGLITSFGGSGVSGSTAGASASIESVNFYSLFGMVGDISGTVLYFTDQLFVWKYSFVTNIISVLAGTGAPGFTGDNGPATSAQLNGPVGLWLTTSGALYVTDNYNHRVRKIITAVAPNIITTVAGSGCDNLCVSGFAGDGGPATSATLYYPRGLYMDSNGNMFIADGFNHRIRVVDTNNIITTFAGTGTTTPFNGENLSALSANINSPFDVKGDTMGNIFIAENANCIVRMVNMNGIIVTLLGTPGVCGYSAGTTVRSSPIKTPWGLWVDSSSTVYVSDGNSIHKSVIVPSLPVVSPNLFMKLIAGGSSSGFSGDNGPATSAQIISLVPWVDTSGNIFIPGDANHRISKINPCTGIITTFGGTATQSSSGVGGIVSATNFLVPFAMVGDTAGTALYFSDQYYIWRYLYSSNSVTVFAHSTTAEQGFSGDNGPASSAQLNNPRGLWLTTSGVFYITDVYNNRIRKVSSIGIITTAAGSTGPGTFSGDNGPATSACLQQPRSSFMDLNGRLFIADSDNHRIRVVDTNNIITTFAGTGASTPYNGENIPATSANVNLPYDVKGDSLGNVYIADYGNCVIRMVNIRGLIINLFGTPSVSDFSGTGIVSRNSPIRTPVGIWIDSSSTIYFSDGNSVHSSYIPPVNNFSPNLFKQLMAGNGSVGFSGDNGPATLAQIRGVVPWVDSNGNIYVPDNINFRIRKVSSSGAIITTLGETGSHTIAGSHGPIGSSSFGTPWSIVGDTSATFLYFSDQMYLWKYLFSDNSLSVIAGTATQGFSGDNGPASLAQLYAPLGLWLTTGNVLFIADELNYRIRKVSLGIITTFAGSGGSVDGFANSDGLPATSAKLNAPFGVFMNSVGKLFIADTHNNRIRLVDTNNIITTFAGTGTQPYNGDNIPATLANIYLAHDVKGDSLGNIYVADYYNCLVRMVDTLGIISTIFGNPTSCGGFSPGISPRTNSIDHPYGLWVDSLSRIYFSELKSIYRSISVSSPTSQPSSQPSGQPTGRPSFHARNDLNLIINPGAEMGSLPPWTSTTVGGKVWDILSSNGKFGLFFFRTRCLGCMLSQNVTLTPGTTYALSFWSSNSATPPGSSSAVLSAYLDGQLIVSTPAVVSSSYISVSKLFVAPNDNNNGNHQLQFAMSVITTGTPTLRLEEVGLLEVISPTSQPSGQPLTCPSAQPSVQPSLLPTTQPSISPTCPTGQPSRQPSRQPTVQPSIQPSSQPTRQPTGQPSDEPTVQPSGRPTTRPTMQPSGRPSRQPSSQPFACPFSQPTSQPLARPATRPTGEPSRQPSSQPSAQPSRQPSTQTSVQPSVQPSSQPTIQPSRQPLSFPSSNPTGQPITIPSSQPSTQPSGQPSHPTAFPSSRPTSEATDLLFMELLAGTGSPGDFGDDLEATVAEVKVVNLWVDSQGTLYLPDDGDFRIRRVGIDGIIRSFGGTAVSTSTGIGGHDGALGNCGRYRGHSSLYQ